MQCRQNKDVVVLLFRLVDTAKEYTNFCLVCKLWKEVGKTLKNEMADKFRLYCYKQTSHNQRSTRSSSQVTFLKLTEYYHLPNEKLHGPWTVTLTKYDQNGVQMDSVKLVRYVYSFGKLIYMASQKEIDEAFKQLNIQCFFDF